MKRYLLVFMLVFTVVSLSFSQTVDTIEVYSPKMQRNIKNVVILPEGYSQNAETKYPVVYMLHGYGGRYDSWLKTTKKDLPQDASNYNMIFVCPDGQNSWYWDSPLDPMFQFETYVSKELVNYIDQKYKTIASPKGRAITGLSMGGHGALFLGIMHPDVFGACGSMSGGVDIRPFPKNWSMQDRLGSYKTNSGSWDEHTVMMQLDRIEPNALAIIFDCGVDDFFYKVNLKLHEEMLYRNIKHEFTSRPGTHNHPYWNNSMKHHLVFFNNFFNEVEKN